MSLVKVGSLLTWKDAVKFVMHKLNRQQIEKYISEEGILNGSVYVTGAKAKTRACKIFRRQK